MSFVCFALFYWGGWGFQPSQSKLWSMGKYKNCTELLTWGVDKKLLYTCIIILVLFCVCVLCFETMLFISKKFGMCKHVNWKIVLSLYFGVLCVYFYFIFVVVM